MKYLAIALFAIPFVLMILASYFLNTERGEDWQKPEDKGGK